MQMLLIPFAQGVGNSLSQLVYKLQRFSTLFFGKLKFLIAHTLSSYWLSIYIIVAKIHYLAETTKENPYLLFY